MIIVDPIALGDVFCTRASSASYYDRNGVLQSALANTLRVTYDPADLTKAPYALVEAAATNLVFSSEDFTDAVWNTSGTVAATSNAAVAPDGANTADRLTATASDSWVFHYIAEGIEGVTLTFSVWLRADSPTPLTLFLIDRGGSSANTAVTVNVTPSWQRFTVTRIAAPGATAMAAQIGGAGTLVAGKAVYAWGAQVEAGALPTSYIKTSGGTATRPADVIGPGAGVVYSNAAIDVQTYNVGSTYPKDALVYDPVAHNVFQSLIAGNVGKALSDTTAWTPRGAINRWAMFDSYNNTQTSNPDEIIVVLRPKSISQGLYVGNAFADEVRVSAIDQSDGLISSSTQSLLVSNSGSSFFNWAFKRIKRRTYFFKLDLPVYANALIAICLRKIGANAKCGMCAAGPVDEFGPTLLGLSTEGKDYSSTTFAFDGTSSTTIRPYAKRMTCDVKVTNDQIDYVQDRLFELRQKPIVWVGGPYGSTAVFGRYESFKNVIDYQTQSLMNLSIAGAV